MTTVKDLMKYLATLPPETEVEVLETYSGSYALETHFTPLDLDEYSDNLEFMDFRSGANQFVTSEHSMFGKTFLMFGSES